MAFSSFFPETFFPDASQAARIGIWLILLIFMLLVPSLQAQQEQIDDSGVYKLGAGDMLDIYVYQEPEISKTVTVRSDGAISLPLIGDVKASGHTPEGLAKIIADKLEKFVEAPDVTVTLAESREKVYYILGQVEEPGEYTINRNMTVIQALARSGGFLEWAKKSRIMVVSEPKASQSVKYFDYDEFLDHPEREENILIKAGDTIVVP